MRAASRVPRRVLLALAAAIAVVLSAGTLPIDAGGQAGSALGAGIFVVDGASNATFALADGGTYFLAVATDDASSFVHARLTTNGSLAAELNNSGADAVLVALAAGNYSLALVGRGRAALGWDFTDGSVQTFPVNESVRAFLRPAGTHVNITVSLESAQAVRIAVYDDRLLRVSDTNVTVSGSVIVDLPPSHATSAFLVASAAAGSMPGVFALAWSSTAPPLPGPDLGGQIFTALAWIAVPILLVLVAVLLLRRRGKW